VASALDFPKKDQRDADSRLVSASSRAVSLGKKLNST